MNQTVAHPSTDLESEATAPAQVNTENELAFESERTNGVELLATLPDELFVQINGDQQKNLAVLVAAALVNLLRTGVCGHNPEQEYDPEPYHGCPGDELDVILDLVIGHALGFEAESRPRRREELMELGAEVMGDLAFLGQLPMSLVHYGDLSVVPEADRTDLWPLLADWAFELGDVAPELEDTPESREAHFWAKDRAAHAAELEAASARPEGFPEYLEFDPDHWTYFQRHGVWQKRSKRRRKNLAPDSCLLPDEFFEARPILGQIRDAALERHLLPDALFAAACAYLVGHVQPNVLVTGGIGNPTSLNLSLALMGDSGGSKSSTLSTARDLFQFPGCPSPYSFVPSSGQGIPSAFGDWVKPKGAVTGSFERTRYSAMCIVDESDTISKMRSLQGSTLSSTLRSATMGGMIGSHNVNKETRTHVDALTYSLGTIMCMPSLTADWLVNDAELASGFTQRWLYVPVETCDVVLESVTGPTEIIVSVPFEALPTANTSGNAFDGQSAVMVPRARYVVTATATAVAHTKWLREARGMDDYDPFEAHANLTRIKVAAYLMLMDGRIEMNDEDWDLAEMVLTASRATVGWVEKQIGAARYQGRMAAAEFEGVIIEATEDARQRAAISKVATKALAKIQKAGTAGATWKELRPTVDVPQRAALRMALEDMTGRGVLVVVERTGGLRYFSPEDAPAA